MPQIRISEESYHLLKERAKWERRTLSNMVEVLLIPTVDDIPPTGVDRTVTDAPAHQADIEGAAPLRLCSCGRAIDPQENCEGCGHEPLDCQCDGGPKDVGPTALDLRRAPPRPATTGPSCTCPQSEMKKGKHNKWCPAKV